MHALIFETHSEGHRLQYVRVYVEAIASLASKITLATSPRAVESDEFKTHLTPVLDRLTIDPSLQASAGRGPMAAAMTRLHHLKQAITRANPEHVYIPYGDGLAQFCGAARLAGRSPRPRGVEIEALLMRGRFAYPRSSWREAAFARAWLAATTLAPFDILHILDPLPFDAIQRRGGGLARRARLIPEPVEQLTINSRQHARRQLNLPEHGRIICCAGWLDDRKGVDRVIAAFAKASLRPDDRLLLVGRIDSSIRPAVDQHRELINAGRIIVHEGCVTDEHLALAMSAADVVAATYPRHVGSSGIVVRAARLNRFVLGSDFGWVGMVTRRFGLGMTCDGGSIDRVAQAIPEALDRGASFTPSEAARRFSAFHTQANFAAHISARLRERLGLAASTEDGRPWSWVLEAPQPGATDASV